MSSENLQDLQEQVRVRFEKMIKLRESGDNPFKNGYKPTGLASELHQKFDEKNKEELEAAKAHTSVAGRIIAIRDFGKAGFWRLRDRTGIIQVYISKEKLGEAAYAKARTCDVGDIVFCEGFLFKTKTNELSVNSEKFEILTKN